MKPQLKITAEIVTETTPSEDARTLICDVAREAGYLDDYLKYNLGSAYYVELPRYINRLVEADQIGQARRDLQWCFSGEGIPDDVWSRLVQ